MTQDELIKQAFLRALNKEQANSLNSRQLKIKVRNISIDLHYDSQVIDKILCLTKGQVDLLMITIMNDHQDVVWENYKGWVI